MRLQLINTHTHFYNLHTSFTAADLVLLHTRAGSSSSNKPSDVSGFLADPTTCQQFGKYAFKNKRSWAESLWHADNGFTASCRSRVREQTTPSLPGAGRGGRGSATGGVSKGSSVAVNMQRKVSGSVLHRTWRHVTVHRCQYREFRRWEHR